MFCKHSLTDTVEAAFCDQCYRLVNCNPTDIIKATLTLPRKIKKTTTKVFCPDFDIATGIFTVGFRITKWITYIRQSDRFLRKRKLIHPRFR